jgi:acetyl/propionyl-CoA carboxylase alpha subunit
MRVLEHPRFLSGEFDTSFVDRHMEDLHDEGKGRHRIAAAVAAVMHQRHVAATKAPVRKETNGGGMNPWKLSGRRQGWGR